MKTRIVLLFLLFGVHLALFAGENDRIVFVLVEDGPMQWRLFALNDGAVDIVCDRLMVESVNERSALSYFSIPRTGRWHMPSRTATQILSNDKSAAGHGLPVAVIVFPDKNTETVLRIQKRSLGASCILNPPAMSTNDSPPSESKCAGPN